MKTERKGHHEQPAYQQGDTPTSRQANRYRFLGRGVAITAVLLMVGTAAVARKSARQSNPSAADNSANQVGQAANEETAAELREYIGQQVGGLQKLMVPDDAPLPPPRLPEGTITNNPAFQTTEAKRYLGKLLFFDPVRTDRILTPFGGVLATRQTGSCGACHLGEVAGKSGTLLNFNVGGEGRGYTDASGNFIPRRRPRARHPPAHPADPSIPG
jgi:hypothetical protein